jgi:hypothetical protein
MPEIPRQKSPSNYQYIVNKNEGKEDKTVPVWGWV